MSERKDFIHADGREIVIRAVGRPWVGDGWRWDVDVVIDGEVVGCGGSAHVASVLDIAMDILYGDKNDWLNGGEGALKEAGLR